MHRQRQHGVALQLEVDPVLLGPDDALQHRVDGLQVRRVGHHRHLDRVLAVRGGELAVLTQVVLHVAGALRRARVQVTLELREDLLVRLADDVGQHVEPTPVGHADDDLVQPVLGGGLQHLAEQRDQRLAALQREALLADVLGLQEGLERLGGVEPVEHVLLLVGGRLLVLALDPFLDPAPLLRVLDVHVLDADPAAVRVAQHAEDLAQLHPLPAGEAVDRELAVQVPQGEPVLEDVQVGVLADLEFQRVGVGHQVTAHPVRVDQLVHPGGLVDLTLGVDRDVAHPAHRLVRDAQRGEDLVVEAVLAQDQLVHHLEELAGLRALDDPVVVRAGQRDDLADRQLGQGGLGHALVGGRVFHRADADDRALPLHQPRHRVHGADAARVGQRDRGAGVVLHGQLVAPRPSDHVLVRLPELPEVHLLAALDGGDHQVAAAVRLGQVDRDAEVDVRRAEHRRLAVGLGEGVVHLRVLDQRADHRVADQVGEADLAAPPTGEVVVDHDAVVHQQLRRDRADAGRGGHAQRGVHVLDDLRGDAPQRRGLRAVGARRGGLGGRLGRRGLLRRGLPARLRRPAAAAGLAGAGCAAAGLLAVAGLAGALGWATVAAASG